MSRAAVDFNLLANISFGASGPAKQIEEGAGAGLAAVVVAGGLTHHAASIREEGVFAK